MKNKNQRFAAGDTSGQGAGKICPAPRSWWQWYGADTGRGKGSTGQQDAAQHSFSCVAAVVSFSKVQ